MDDEIVEIGSISSDLFHIVCMCSAESIYHKIKVDSLTNFFDIVNFVYLLLCNFDAQI